MTSAGKILIVGVTLLVLIASAHAAAPSVPAPLPPAAQEALNKGILAAKVPDYLLAIRYFEEARKIAPKDAVIYLNLGIAESKIPGRELRAMAWFGAYLAAYPDAPNAEAVKEQIGVLEVRSQSNVSRLINTLEDAANKIKKSKVWTEDDWGLDERRDNLGKVAKLWQATGNFPAALKIADNTPSILYKPWWKEQIGIAQLEAGDLKGARQTFTGAMRGLVNDLHPLYHEPLSGGRLEARVVSIATGHARTGDIAGALQSADSLKDLDMKSEAQFNIALVQARAGDVAGSVKTFKIADRTADRIHDQNRKEEIRLFFAEEKKKLDEEIADIASNQSTASTPPAIQPSTSVAGWLKTLDDQNMDNDCPLNAEPFLDLAHHLQSLPSNNAKTISDGLFNAATKLVTAQNVITGMLKQQAKR
jgi:tetratricopeptide (TPR) repeat protein